jgi:phosphoserine phosphatase
MSRLDFPLVCFDLDGTLVDDTVFIWKTLHEAFRTDPVRRKRAREDHFAGRLSYPDWFATDLELLTEAGADRESIGRVVDGLPPMRGAHETLAELKRRGHRLAIVSGSLDVVVERLFEPGLFDHMLINRIRFAGDGSIAGGEATPYDLAGKGDGLRHLAAREGIGLESTAFVGDNHNDLWIAEAAGLAIAFNCKSERLRALCQVEVAEKDLRALLDIIS